MKKSLMEFGCISAMVALLCSCIGCASLAEQLVSSDSEIRRVATQTYKQLSAMEQAIVQKELAQMVNTAEDEEIRMEALKQLEDKAELAKIARSCHDDEVRKYTVRFLVEDQQVLAEIAKADSDSLVRQEAVGKLTDQSVLAEIAKTDLDNDVRVTAIWGLTDQSVLAEIAKTASDSRVRQEAIWGLTDQSVLAEIAKTDLDNGVRATAIQGLTDQKVLAEIAKSDVNEDVLNAAAAKLIDQQVIVDVAMNAKSDDVRRIVVDKLDDSHPLKDQVMQEKYATIAKSSTSDFIGPVGDWYAPQKEAVSKLKKQELIRDVVENARYQEVRCEAIGKVNSFEYLNTLLKTEKYKDCHGAILARINELNSLVGTTSVEKIEFDKPFTVTHGNIASGNYRLTKNVELVSSIRVATGNTVRIDLANFSIKGADIIVSDGARLELYNGKIKCTQEHDNLNSVFRTENQIRNNGFLLIDKVDVKILVKNYRNSYLRFAGHNFLLKGGTLSADDETAIDLGYDGKLIGHIVRDGKIIPQSEASIVFKTEEAEVGKVVVVGALPGKFVARLPRGYFVEERSSKIEGLVDLVIIRE